MIPVDPGQVYGRLITYGMGQYEFEPLPARLDYEGGTFTVWELSPDARAAVAAGARIGLRVLTGGRPLQPVNLAVENTEGWPYEFRVAG